MYNKEIIKILTNKRLRLTSELSKEAVTDQPQQRSDVQLQFLFSQVDPQFIQNSGKRRVHVANHLDTQKIWVSLRLGLLCCFATQTCVCHV